jgi:hypothetical protein
MGLKGYRLWVMGQLDSNVQRPTVRRFTTNNVPSTFLRLCMSKQSQGEDSSTSGGWKGREGKGREGEGREGLDQGRAGVVVGGI